MLESVRNLIKLRRGPKAIPPVRSNSNPNFRGTFPVLPSDRGRLWHAASSAVISLSGGVGQILIWKLNNTKILHYDRFQEVVVDRAKGTPVLTASNHSAVTDDWFLCSTVGQHRQALSGNMRYVLGAEEVMFWSPLVAEIMAAGRVLPTRRGHGVYQIVMDECLRLLGQGSWLHIYPQGAIMHNRDEERRVRLKWGIGRLVAECPGPVLPKILPMWHVGMDDIIPNKRPYRLSFGHRISLVVGKAMDFSDLVHEMRRQGSSAMRIRKVITDQLQERLKELREEAYEFHDNRS